MDVSFTVSGFCNEFKSILQFVGWIITIVKIFMPILIIIFGVFDMGKAIVANDEKAIGKSAKQLGIRIVAGLVIFFLPSIILWIFSLVNSYNDADQNSDFTTCQNCILTPWNCK